MTSHQDRLRDLELELMNSYAEVHQTIKSARQESWRLNKLITQAEEKADAEFEALIRRVQDLEIQVEESVASGSIASDAGAR